MLLSVPPPPPPVGALVGFFHGDLVPVPVVLPYFLDMAVYAAVAAAAAARTASWQIKLVRSPQTP